MPTNLFVVVSFWTGGWVRMREGGRGLTVEKT